MPKGMIIALTIIFALTCGMIVKTIWLLQKENKNRGGDHRNKHYNGRFFW